MNPALISHPRYPLIRNFDMHDHYIKDKLTRDIRENRMGTFSLAFTDETGKRIYPDSVSVRQVNHEFKFGCSLFLLDQFPDAEKNAAYREAFSRIFNYGVAPLYWNTLEPDMGHPRFASDSAPIWRRPPLDTVRTYCRENSIRMKGHCLAYNSFNPDWMSNDNRKLKMQLTERAQKLGERYRYDFEDMDVINEMFTVYKNCYRGNGMRNFQITDETDHAKFCFDLAKREFPCTRLFWNEGCFETFGTDYTGNRSRYYLMLKEELSRGTRIEGIGMQFHAFTGKDDEITTAGRLYNSLRAIDIFDRYGDFGLPIHLSEVSIPSWSNAPDDEAIQAELVERMVTLWFSQKYVESMVWWNLVDGTAYGGENIFHAGLMRNDLSPKPAYEVLDRLINHTWNTALERHGLDTENGSGFYFDGFYGDYEITFTHNGHTYSDTVRLYRDTTGYDNRLGDFRLSYVTMHG